MLNERFWTKVSLGDANDCWEWTANQNNKGYGLFRPGGTLPKRLAHRLSYEAANGPIPAGMVILHSCDNPACVNPAHLQAGTQKHNMEDAAHKERVSNTRLTAAQVIALLKDYVAGVPREQLALRYGLRLASLGSYTSGEAWTHLHGKHGCPTLDELKQAKRKTPNAKITADIAREIKRALADGETGRSIAARFGIHFGTISDIKTGKIWREA